MSKEDRIENRNLKISLRELRGQIRSVPDFTKDELMESFKNMRLKGPTTEPDHTSPSFLKNLRPDVIKLLLHMFNNLLTTEIILQVWRNANIKLTS